MYFTLKNNKYWRYIKNLCVYLLILSLILSPSTTYAQALMPLPTPGAMVTPTSAFVPSLLKGMTVHPEDPLRFDFIIDSGNRSSIIDDRSLVSDNEKFKQESKRLIKYFLASLTVPKDELWVNLSPNEEDRIIPDALGSTDLGRDLLAQDYILKQLTASLMYPEDELGKKFWDKVYKEAYERYGTTDIPVDTFNKVWIIPESASVYENGNTVFIVDAKLKVMLEQDYLAQKNHDTDTVGADSHVRPKQIGENQELEGRHGGQPLQDFSLSIIREIIIPAIEKEVNEGANFATLRQIYNSLILAKWYKDTVKNSILSQVYIDKNKTAGININDPKMKEKLYEKYMEAYKKGVYNYIKDEYDPATKDIIPRKYFSGGFRDNLKEIKHVKRSIDPTPIGDFAMVSTELNEKAKDDDLILKMKEYFEQGNRKIPPQKWIKQHLGISPSSKKFKSLINLLIEMDTTGDEIASRMKLAALYYKNTLKAFHLVINHYRRELNNSSFVPSKEELSGLFGVSEQTIAKYLKEFLGKNEIDTDNNISSDSAMLADITLIAALMTGFSALDKTILKKFKQNGEYPQSIISTLVSVSVISIAVVLAGSDQFNNNEEILKLIRTDSFFVTLPIIFLSNVVFLRKSIFWARRVLDNFREYDNDKIKEAIDLILMSMLRSDKDIKRIYNLILANKSTKYAFNSVKFLDSRLSKEVLFVKNKLLKEIPLSNSKEKPYNIPEKAFELLPKALKLREKGYDFRIIHIPEKGYHFSGRSVGAIKSINYEYEGIFRDGEIEFPGEDTWIVYEEEGLGIVRGRKLEYPFDYIREDKDVREFITKMLTARYSSWGLNKEFAENIINKIVKADASAKEIRKQITELDSKEYKAAYEKYKDKKHFIVEKSISNYLEELPYGSVVLDVGAGDNLFAKTLSKKYKNLIFVGTDPFRAEEYKRGNVEFYKQRSLNKLDFEDGFASVIILNKVLHHTDEMTMNGLLKEAKRVLKKGGKIFLFEATYPSEVNPFKEVKDGIDIALTNEFISLIKKHGDEFAQKVISFIDYYGNVFVKNEFNAPMAYNYRSLENWAKAFKKHGFKEERSEFLGIEKNVFHRTPLGEIVFSKNTGLSHFISYLKNKKLGPKHRKIFEVIQDTRPLMTIDKNGIFQYIPEWEGLLAKKFDEIIKAIKDANSEHLKKRTVPEGELSSSDYADQKQSEDQAMVSDEEFVDEPLTKQRVEELLQEFFDRYYSWDFLRRYGFSVEVLLPQEAETLLPIRVDQERRSYLIRFMADVDLKKHNTDTYEFESEFMSEIMRLEIGMKEFFTSYFLSLNNKSIGGQLMSEAHADRVVHYLLVEKKQLSGEDKEKIQIEKNLLAKLDFYKTEALRHSENIEIVTKLAKTYLELAAFYESQTFAVKYLENLYCGFKSALRAIELGSKDLGFHFFVAYELVKDLIKTDLMTLDVSNPKEIMEKIRENPKDPLLHFRMGYHYILLLKNANNRQISSNILLPHELDSRQIVDRSESINEDNSIRYFKKSITHSMDKLRNNVDVLNDLISSDNPNKKQKIISLFYSLPEAYYGPNLIHIKESLKKKSEEEIVSPQTVDEMTYALLSFKNPQLDYDYYRMMAKHLSDAHGADKSILRMLHVFRLDAYGDIVRAFFRVFDNGSKEIRSLTNEEIIKMQQLMRSKLEDKKLSSFWEKVIPQLKAYNENSLIEVLNLEFKLLQEAIKEVTKADEIFKVERKDQAMAGQVKREKVKGKRAGRAMDHAMASDEEIVKLLQQDTKKIRGFTSELEKVYDDLVAIDRKSKEEKDKAVNQFMEVIVAYAAILHQMKNAGINIDDFDSALTTKNPGGINMNNIEVDRKGNGHEIRFKPDAFDNIISPDFQGFEPVIINITPITNILPILGLADDEKDKGNQKVLSQNQDLLAKEPEDKV